MKCIAHDEVYVTMKVREVIERIEKDGWVQIRMRGSHRIFQHSIKSGNVLVAGNPGNDVPIGLLKQIFKQAGLEDKP